MIHRSFKFPKFWQRAAIGWMFVIGLEARSAFAADTEVSPSADPQGAFQVEERPDRLIITRSDRPVAEFVFRDEKILRPYVTRLHAPGGLQLTRNHPPQPNVDATDHDLMHPGLWLAFGDISGHDFWRNKATIEHVRFIAPPGVENGDLRFSTESRLLTATGDPLCQLTSRFHLADRPAGYLLVWDATFRSDTRDITFGDQEEMGFGARLATPLIEKNGGRLLNSHGKTTAAQTWGQPAAWCDYAGTADGRTGGITLLTAAANFRESWWHNRDYGLIVANPFGRAAMKQGAPSSVTIEPKQSFRLRFAALLHDAPDYNPEAASRDALKFLKLQDSR